jgi:hypothetical protein
MTNGVGRLVAAAAADGGEGLLAKPTKDLRFEERDLSDGYRLSHKVPTTLIIWRAYAGGDGQPSVHHRLQSRVSFLTP